MKPSKKVISKNVSIVRFGLFFLFITTASVVYSSDSVPKSPVADASLSPILWQQPSLESWWNGNGASANGLGLGTGLQNAGLTVTGEFKQAYFGQVSGGLPNQSPNNWITEVKLNFHYDFSKIFGLNGLELVSQWRYRNDGNNPEYVAGTGYSSGSSPSFMFNPSSATSGLGIRILPQYLEYSTPNKSITMNAGWENPYDLFLQQPLSKMFENNAIRSAKGIGGTAGPGVPIVNYTQNAKGQITGSSVGYYNTSPVPWSSSYASWGGTLKVKPSSQTYGQSGLYLAIANTGDIGGTQFTPTSVYPYTSVPQSYLGQFKSSGQIVPVVGGNGQIIPGAYQNLGYSRPQNDNHGFNFQGAPSFSPYITNIGVKPAGTVTGTATYKNAAGQTVTAPAYYAASPYNPGNNNQYSQNGLYNVNEIGWTPKFGKDKLEGHYALGGYIWGQENSDYTPVAFTQSTFNPKTGAVTYASYAAKKPVPFQENQVVWGMYFQADQQLYRVHEKNGEVSFSGKTSKEKLSERGLYLFNEFTFTPPQNNALPVYFQTGLVFKGLLGARPKDSIGIALGAGFYSAYYNAYIRSQNQALENAYGSLYNATAPNGPVSKASVNPATGNPSAYANYYAYAPAYSSTEVLETFYNIQINNWASVKPYAQFIANPAGNGTVGNDVILGFSAHVTF